MGELPDLSEAKNLAYSPKSDKSRSLSRRRKGRLGGLWVNIE